ncbi:MAG: VRR-NUC domain-containing protein [Gammaproteobacteria bacterium]|nr:VRR-NUC domain-containing protein [Gammaproteobacteria bacterium]
MISIGKPWVLSGMARPEDALQRSVVALLKMYERQGLLLFHHVPNGGRMSVARGANLQRMGVRAGVADLEIQWNPGMVGYIELKAPGRIKKLSEKQKKWRDSMIAIGHRYTVADSLDKVEEALQEWGVI